MILEELDEYRREVFRKREARDVTAMVDELVQIAAMAQRAAEDVHQVGLSWYETQRLGAETRSCRVE